MFEKLSPEALQDVQKYLVARIEWQISAEAEPDAHAFEDLGRVCFELIKRGETDKNNARD